METDHYDSGYEIMVCRGACKSFKDVKHYRSGRKMPNSKTCKECEVQFPYEGIWCPCCGQRVRYKPRNKGKLEKHYGARIEA